MNSIVYPGEGELPLDDPRVEVHVEDGRYYLETTDKRFDLITGEPPPPKMAGIVTLYTREYFQLTYDRLNEGGILSYWLPVHVLSPDDSKSIIAAFCEVFEDCTLWGGAGLDWILLGTRNASGPGSVEAFSRQWSDPVVGPDLKLLAVERPEQLGALFMAGPDDLRALAGGAPPLTDDFPKRLSDARFDLVAGLKSYIPWIDKANTQLRFERSPWIAKVWPKEVRERTPPYFLAQWELTRLHIERRALDMEQVLPKLHPVLTETELSTLPLWLLTSDGLRQQAARAAHEEDGASARALSELGLGALSERQYARASTLFTAAGRAGGGGAQLRTVSVYSLFMSMDPKRREELVQSLEQPGAAAQLEPWLVPFLRRALTP